MRRIALLAIAISLLAGLAAAPSAFGIKAGFNLATERLEAAYKVALFERRFDPQGCYPAPAELAKDIQASSKRKVGVARNTRRLGNVNQVYVLKQGTTCEHLRMALRAAGGIYVLDSKLGTVRLQGRKGASTPGLARRLTNLTLATRSFRLTKPDGKGFYELFAVEEFEGSLRFVVKHFNPNWVGWEEKDQAVKLALRKIGENEASFGGVGFRREGNDNLLVDLTMRMKDGTTRTEVLRFKRRPL